MRRIEVLVPYLANRAINGAVAKLALPRGACASTSRNAPRSRGCSGSAARITEFICSSESEIMEFGRVFGIGGAPHLCDD